MNFLRKFFDFVSRPTHSRTMGLLGIFALAIAVTFTVVSGQNQQTIKQRASFDPEVGYLPDPTPTPTIVLTESNLPACGNGLTCDASSIISGCSSGKNICLSAKDFDGAEKVDGKNVVCCNARKYKLIDNVCTLSTIGLHSDLSCDQSSSAPTEIAPCESGLNCEARATCLSRETKCTTGKDFGNDLDQLNGQTIVCCAPPASAPAPDPNSCEGKSGICVENWKANSFTPDPKLKDYHKDVNVACAGFFTCFLPNSSLTSTPTPTTGADGTTPPTATPTTPPAIACSIPAQVQNVKITIDGKTCP